MARRPPASEPVKRPSQSEPKALAMTAPAKAPRSSWPSMAMLMTPDRSHRQPESAPSTSGIEASIVDCMSDTNGSGIRPASDQHRKATTKASVTVPATRRWGSFVSLMPRIDEAEDDREGAQSLRHGAGRPATGSGR